MVDLKSNVFQDLWCILKVFWKFVNAIWIFFSRDALGTFLKLFIEQSCVYRNVLKDKILETTHSEVSVAMEISWSQQ